MQILGFPEYAPQARALAAELGVDCHIADVHRFPDGESRVRLPPALADHVIVCRSLDYPNDKLIELMLAAATARTLGVRRLTLVAPYLCYMRQDHAFQPGEAVSQRIVGRFLADRLDAVITVDPHLHRIDDLAQAIPLRAALTVSAAPTLGRYLRDHGSGALLLGPDRESAQWVRSVADTAGLEHRVAEKTRHGDSHVTVSLPTYDFHGRDVVLVDDVISTGATLAAAAQQLLSAGARRVQVLVTHALCAGDALPRLRDAGISDVWSSDTIADASNVVSVAPLLATALRDSLSRA